MRQCAERVHATYGVSEKSLNGARTFVSARMSGAAETLADRNVRAPKRQLFTSICFFCSLAQRVNPPCAFESRRHGLRQRQSNSQSQHHRLCSDVLTQPVSEKPLQ